MAYTLKEFLVAEIEEIKRSVGRNDEMDRELFSRKAIEWIERNAARFRDEWSNAKGNQRSVNTGSENHG